MPPTNKQHDCYQQSINQCMYVLVEYRTYTYIHTPSRKPQHPCCAHLIAQHANEATMAAAAAAVVFSVSFGSVCLCYVKYVCAQPRRSSRLEYLGIAKVGVVAAAAGSPSKVSFRTDRIRTCGYFFDIFVLDTKRACTLLYCTAQNRTTTGCCVV